jgi:hypothetical protein
MFVSLSKEPNTLINLSMYEGYLKLICRYLSNDMYTKLTRKRILYGDITYVYGKTYVIVM